MLIKTITELAAEFDDVRAAILGDRREWLTGLADEAASAADELVVNVGLEVAGQHIGGRARLEVGEPVTIDRVVMLPVRLQARDHGRLFPSLECSLDAAWLGRGRTYLALSAIYEPPLGMVGRAVDRALLHRVAETAAQRFLHAVTRELAARADWRRCGRRPSSSRRDALGRAALSGRRRPGSG